MKVKITSPCMAMLLYEAAKSTGQVEGCLCGELTTEVSKNITDSDVTTTTEEVLSVHSIGPLDLPKSNEELTLNPSNIFGWYKFCRRPLLHLSVREKSIHRKVARCLRASNGYPVHVVTILMQERWSENHSTYLWKFAAFLQKDRWFFPCKLEVVNLVSTPCGSYKPYPSIHLQERLPQFTDAMKSLSKSLCSNDESSFRMVETVRNTGHEVVKFLNETIVRLRKTEDELEVAYEEQDNLKRRLHELKAVHEHKIEYDRNKLHQRTLYYRTSDTTETSESSDSAEYYGEEKTDELLRDLKRDEEVFHDAPNIAGAEKCKMSENRSEEPMSVETVIASESQESGIDVGVIVASPQEEPPRPYDPFGTLVDMAKADLTKIDATTKQSTEISSIIPSKDDSECLAEYNDDRPWSDRTRAGRLKNSH